MNERQEAQDSSAGSAKSTAKLKADRAQRRAPTASQPKKKRTGPRKFIREAISELKKVDWPARREVVTYTTVVLISVVFMGALIFFMDLGFAKLIFGFFKG